MYVAPDIQLEIGIKNFFYSLLIINFIILVHLQGLYFGNVKHKLEIHVDYLFQFVISDSRIFWHHFKQGVKHSFVLLVSSSQFEIASQGI